MNAFARLTNLRKCADSYNKNITSRYARRCKGIHRRDLTVAAEPKNGILPEEAAIELNTSGRITKESMSFNGKAFTYNISSINKDTVYRILSEDFASGWYMITTSMPLKIDSIKAILTFPDYLNISAPFMLPDMRDDIRVLKGTHIDFHVYTNKDIAEGSIELDNAVKALMLISKRDASAGLDVQRDLAFRIVLKDTDGFSLREQIERKVYCIIDDAPFAEIIEPSSEIKANADKTFTVIIKARDDVALAALTLIAGREGTAEKILNEWKYNDGIIDSLDSLKTMAIESFAFALNNYFKDGDSGFIYASVMDMKGTKHETGRISVKVISADETKRMEEAEEKSILDKLREILDLQVYARKALEAMSKKDAQLLASARDKQAEVYNKSLSLIGILKDASKEQHKNIRASLLSLASNQMVDAVRLFDVMSQSFVAKNKREISTLQEEIENELRRLLGETVTEEKDEDAKQAADEGTEKNEEPPSFLKDMQAILRNFVAEQKRVIASSQELAAKKPEDFTREDEELKRKLQMIEDQWAKFLDEKSTELDKIPEQDFSKPSMVKELRQIYEEVDVAASELTKPGIHLPVTEEQIGLELAEKLEAKLESWLTNESDKIKWDLEEPSKDYTAPMAELPEELEDLIGDLIRNEEDLDSEMEDVSSSWTDSLDKGAGWDTMDGPISNMSAKGKTGNTLPNSSEISGRSGEGRQGKSNGEFVTDTAIGKGGRRTPTRLMNEPYEKGVVKDEMTQETGGATGGGKLSGEGGEGVRGHVPPDVQMKIAKAREKYSDIINRGEHIAHQLNKLGFSSDKLDETIQLMKGLDYQMANFKYGDIVGVHREIIDGLETSKGMFNHEAEIRQEENARMPKKIRRLLNDAMSVEFPEDYEELLKGYYKSISR